MLRQVAKIKDQWRRLKMTAKKISAFEKSLHATRGGVNTVQVTDMNWRIKSLAPHDFYHNTNPFDADGLLENVSSWDVNRYSDRTCATNLAEQMIIGRRNVWYILYGRSIFYVTYQKTCMVMRKARAESNALHGINKAKANLSGLLEDVPLNLICDMWFQYDGCPAYYRRNVREWLDTNYPTKRVGRGGPITWPARSPDPTPIDFYVWGHLKSLLYTEPNPITSAVLRQ
ncbi:hypothetical protein EVAR_32518_1 [Eumeta japonica]|uniref:Uncharacterized protein n=1 Tax=Eumeta variegata TaxID=151549 RepID=A0A4C1W8Z1_EUMVA|nr:hypothetical protein EVAR_32518_1 [Eumeta japonica]